MGTNTDQFNRTKANLADGLEWIERNVLAYVPEPGRTVLSNQLQELRKVLQDRPPRFVIVGRRGSGKSSLINAIFSAPVAATGSVRSTTMKGEWYTYANDLGEMEILDTRGLGEGNPCAKDRADTAESSIRRAIDEKAPDAILFLCKAKEVDSRIDEDLGALYRIGSYVQKKHGLDLTAIGISSQVDELDPIEITDPPYDDADKQDNISQAAAVLRKRLSDCLSEDTAVIPISAYMRFRGAEIVAERRWNIDTLTNSMLETIPESARMTFARIAQLQFAQTQIARKIVDSAAAVAAGVAATPIPVADLPVITAVQGTMIMAVACVFRGTVDRRIVTEFLAASGLNIAGAFGFREVARALIKLLPGPGNAVSAAVAFTATKGMGEGAIAYFLKPPPQPSPTP